METITTPSPGLYAFVLRVLATADPWDSSESMCMKQLSQHLTSKQAREMPYAIGRVLALLQATVTSLQFASDIIVAFNLYEAAPHLVNAALGPIDRPGHRPDHRLLLNAASIAGHPSVVHDVRERMAEAVSDIPAARVRLDPRAPTPSDRLVRLQRRCWPGLQTKDTDTGFPPTVVFDQSVDRRAMLWLSSSLHLHGYTIRRIGEDGHLPEWFGKRTTVICTAESTDQFSQLGLNPHQIIQTHTGTLDEDTVNMVLSEVWRSRPPNWKPDIKAPTLSDGLLPRGSLMHEIMSIFDVGRLPYEEAPYSYVLHPYILRQTHGSSAILREWKKPTQYVNLPSRRSDRYMDLIATGGLPGLSHIAPAKSAAIHFEEFDIAPDSSSTGDMFVDDLETVMGKVRFRKGRKESIH